MGNNNGAKDYSFYFEGNNGRGVLLIHGITGTPSEMRHLGRRLNQAGFSVLCNTLPRHCSTLAELKKVTWQEIYAACRKDLQWLESKSDIVFAGGLSMGALMAAHLAYERPKDVRAIIALAPTFFYDGWALHKGKFLMDFLWHIPFLRNAINIRETPPYGLKDQNLRANLARFYKHASARKFYKESMLFGSPFFPMANLYQHRLFAKVVMKELSSVNTPVLIIHAKEDDMTSPRNAEYLYSNIGADNKSFLLLEDSYHMITIDKEKDRVAEETIKFINGL